MINNEIRKIRLTMWILFKPDVQRIINSLSLSNFKIVKIEAIKKVKGINFVIILGIERKSKPGRRIYVDKHNLPQVKRNYGIAILSTSKGIMTDNDARSKKIGGEIICRVF